MNIFQTLKHHRRLAAQLRSLPQMSLTPESRQAIKAIFLEKYSARPVAPIEPRTDLGWLPRHAWAAGFASLILVLGAAGTVAVAQTAGPGDPLYGLDRAIDRAHLALGLNAKHKAAIAASIAEERQAELEKINQAAMPDTTVKLQAETDADEALDRAIEAVGRVKAQSEKNLEAITTRAEEKVNHLLELREKQRAREGSDDERDETPEENRETTIEIESSSDLEVDDPETNDTLKSEDDDERDEDEGEGEGEKVQIQSGGRFKVR